MSLFNLSKKKIAESESQYMKELDLSEMGLNPKDIIEIVELIKSKNVKIGSLNLYRNNIGNDGAIALSTLSKDSIDFLNVCFCGITDAGASELFRSEVSKLDISFNDLTDKSLDIFIKELKQTVLIFNGNTKISSLKLIEAEEKLEQIKKSNIKSLNTSALSFFLNENVEDNIPSTLEISIGKQQWKITIEEAIKIVLSIIEKVLQKEEPFARIFIKQLEDVEKKISYLKRIYLNILNIWKEFTLFFILLLLSSSDS